MAHLLKTFFVCAYLYTHLHAIGSRPKEGLKGADSFEEHVLVNAFSDFPCFHLPCPLSLTLPFPPSSTVFPDLSSCQGVEQSTTGC